MSAAESMNSLKPRFSAWPRPKPTPANTEAANRFQFLWGVATSAYQHEGGLNGPGQPQNNWSWAEQDGRIDSSRDAADFWHLAEEDFSRCRAMGLNAFRLGLSWERIQPALTLGAPETMQEPPPFDEAALKRYAEILAACRRAGLEPVVTLHHFTHPAWLGIDAWLDPRMIDHYVAYVEKTVGYLLAALPRDHGMEPPRFFITINEPNMLAGCHYLNGVFPSGAARSIRKTFTCITRLLEAHIRAYRAIHRLYREAGAAKPLVTFNNYCSDLYWMDQGWLDLLCVHARGVPREQIFPHLWEQARTLDAAFSQARLPIRPVLRRWCGQVLKKIHHLAVYAYSLDEAWPRLLDLIYESPEVPLDYLAIDYYDPFIAHALRLPHWQDELQRPSALRRPFHERFLESITNKWWDWRLLPEGLAFFVRSLDRFDLPILIAENGMANRSDHDTHHGRRDKLRRSIYLRQHVGMVRQLKLEGWPLIGYLHWSLVDNYEWGSYAPRFGLYTRERSAVDFRGDNAAETYAEEVAASRDAFSRIP